MRSVNTPPSRPTIAPVLVACLCAEWCTTCQAYAATFEDVARQFPALRFAWIDIETHADALGDAALDIENFPTVMILRGDQPAFLGTVLPHGSTLVRMLQALADGALAPAGLGARAQALAPGVLRLSTAAAMTVR